MCKYKNYDFVNKCYKCHKDIFLSILNNKWGIFCPQLRAKLKKKSILGGGIKSGREELAI
jgi:hypothetical protein